MDNDDVPDVTDDLEEVEVIYSDDEINFEDGFEEVVDELEEEEQNVGTIDDIEVIDTSKLTFNKHTNSVFSIDLSKDGQLAISGGQDDSAYVWSTSTGEVVLECTGHKDSVTQTCFNHDSQMVATGDMSGMIQVWNVHETKLIWCFEGDDMEWLLWHPLANVLLCGCRSGEVYIWQVPQGNCKVLASHGAPSTCGRVLPDGKRLLTGYSDGIIKLWDIKSAAVEWQSSEAAPQGPTSIEISADASIAAVAPSATIFKIADGKVITTLLVEGESEVESILFNTESNVLVSGSLTGQLCVWDLGRRVIRHQARIECAVTVIKSGLDGKTFVGATDGAIYVCDIRTGTLLDTLTGHKAEILALAVAKDGSFLATASDDGTAKIFKV